MESLSLDSVDCYLRVMDALKEEIRRLSLGLRHIAAGVKDIRLLMTIPSVDYYNALLVKAKIGDINRFRSGNQLTSHTGLVLSTYSSGGVTRHGRITQEGSRWLQWAMVEVVHSHLRYYMQVTQIYYRIAERRGRQTTIVAVTRKMLSSSTTF